jgi:hypothetical protein
LILQDPEINVDEKKRQINQIMSELPAEVIEKLPMPMAFMKMPKEIQRNLRKILFNFKLEWNERHRQLRQYIRTLPKTYRRTLRASLITSKVHEMAKANGISTKDVSLPEQMAPFSEPSTTQASTQ